MAMKYQMTWEDIEKADKEIADGCERANYCPVAQTMVRYGLYDPVVMDDEIQWNDGKAIEPSAELTEFIHRYDMGRPVTPIVFELE